MSHPTTQKPWKPSYYLVSAILLSLGIATFVQRQALTNPFAINDDVRNQIYWMARLVDPGLFPNDIVASYFTQSSLVSPIVWLIYWLASHVMDPVRAGQLLPLALAPLATFFLYRFGENFSGKRYGFLLAFSFNLIIWIGRNLAGGLARAFAYPLLFAFLFFMSKNNRWGLILTCWAASLIYPPILFLNAGVWLLELMPHKAPDDAPAPDKLSFLLGIGGGLGILAYRFLFAPLNPEFGALANSTVAAHTPEFYEGGRVPIFHFFQQPITLSWPNAFFAELLARIPGFSRLAPLAGVLLAYWIFQKFIAPKFGTLKVPQLTWRVFGASVGLYILAWVALFYLYVPERYLQLSIPVLYTFLMAGLLDVFARNIRTAPFSNRAKAAVLITPLTLCMLGLSFAWDQNLMKPKPLFPPIIEALKQTPKNALIATTPGLASDIPAYAQRSVVLSEEGYIPFHQAYFAEMKTRLREFLRAYYSKEPTPLVQFIQKYKVDYIVVNLEDYTPRRTSKLYKKYYHSFPKSFYQQLTDNAQPQDFILTHTKPSCRLVQSGNYILIPATAILSGTCLENPKPLLEKP